MYSNTKQVEKELYNFEYKNKTIILLLNDYWHKTLRVFNFRFELKAAYLASMNESEQRRQNRSVSRLQSISIVLGLAINSKPFLSKFASTF